MEFNIGDKVKYIGKYDYPFVDKNTMYIIKDIYIILMNCYILLTNNDGRLCYFKSDDLKLVENEEPNYLELLKGF